MEGVPGYPKAAVTPPSNAPRAIASFPVSSFLMRRILPDPTPRRECPERPGLSPTVGPRMRLPKSSSQLFPSFHARSPKSLQPEARRFPGFVHRSLCSPEACRFHRSLCEFDLTQFCIFVASKSSVSVREDYGRPAAHTTAAPMFRLPPRGVSRSDRGSVPCAAQPAACPTCGVLPRPLGRNPWGGRDVSTKRPRWQGRTRRGRVPTGEVSIRPSPPNPSTEVFVPIAPAFHARSPKSLQPFAPKTATRSLLHFGQKWHRIEPKRTNLPS